MPTIKNTTLNSQKTQMYFKNVPIKNLYVKQPDGSWLPEYRYAWEAGPWSACSAQCGGGIQTRNVKCKRHDGIYRDDPFCSDIVKPALQNPCNSQPCGELTIRFTDCTYCCPQWGSCTSNILYMNFDSPIIVPGVYGLFMDYRLTYECRRRCGSGDLRLLDVTNSRIYLSVSSDSTDWDNNKIYEHWDVYGKANNPISVQRTNQYLGEINILQPTGVFVYRAWTQRREHDHGFGIWNMRIWANYIRAL